MDTAILYPDFREFLQSLNAKGVEYLLVGGFAVNLHGYARGTVDLDVWVAMNAANAARVIEALTEFGFATPALRLELFTQPDEIVTMGIAPFRIDVFTSIKGVSFQECYARRQMMDAEGITVPVISLEDLKEAKRAAGRHKDLDDLDNLR